MRIGVPSIIFGAGAAGVGKTTVIKQVVRDLTDVFLLEKDVSLESYLHTNPFLLRKPDGTLDADTRYSFSSPEYARHFRDQVYASMFQTGIENTKLGKSTVLDANYVGWLKDPNGRISLARRVANLYAEQQFSSFRMPILFFYVTDPEVVRERIIKRMEHNPAAKDRDWNKVATKEAWQKQIEKEPVTWFSDLDQYNDLLGIDLTEEYHDQRTKVKKKIVDFLAQQKTLADGIFKNEPLSVTLERYK